VFQVFLATLRGNLGEPDDRLGGLDLAKERANPIELIVPPMLEKPPRLRVDQPVIRVR